MGLEYWEADAQVSLILLDEEVKRANVVSISIAKIRTVLVYLFSHWENVVH